MKIWILESDPEIRMLWVVFLSRAGLETVEYPALPSGDLKGIVVSDRRVANSDPSTESRIREVLTQHPQALRFEWSTRAESLGDWLDRFDQVVNDIFAKQ
jgi:hypothetical protein